ncbi:MAG TPA: hypothetical protein PL066_00390 [bacterium]|nr:hypothetical protein [bacterium]
MVKAVIINWLNELADAPPRVFQEYFYDDIRNFIVDQGDKSEKIKLLFQCKNKDEVKNWLNNISGYVIMKLDIDLLLDNYFYFD